MYTSLEEIALDIKVCKKCRLCSTRINAVAGEGSPNAELLFLGEAPGKQEDIHGRPFVGRSGKFLDELLKSINLNREDVFITNLVKCRPPNNRDPQPDEIASCHFYIENQIKILKPILIITLGRHSMNLFLPNAKISEVHGQVQKHKIFGIETDQMFFPLYHPALALYNPKYKDVLLEDFAKIPILIKQIKNS